MLTDGAGVMARLVALCRLRPLASASASARGAARSPADAIGGTPAAGCAPCSLGTGLRGLHKYNYVQPVDTNRLNELLSAASVLEHAALPVLQHGRYFNPEQVTRTLQRLPRMMRRQQRRRDARLADGVAPRVLDALGARLAAVAPDCTDAQLARALWAYGAARYPQREALQAACEQLPARMARMPPQQLATAAWGLAAAGTARGAGEDVRDGVRRTLQDVARHLVAARPAALPQPAAPPPQRQLTPVPLPAVAGAASAQAVVGYPTASAAAAAAAAAELKGAPAWLDHRSALKLAWAFAATGVRDKEALDVVAEAAADRIRSQLAQHDASQGAPLAPRATFLYRAVRGWQAWPRPRPPRAGTAASARSRYLYDERPRVVLRDFAPTTLAALVAAFARLGHRHDGLLEAAARHVVASAGPGLYVRPATLARFAGAYARLDSARPLLPPAGDAADAGAHTALLPPPRRSAASRRAMLAALLRCSHMTELPAPVLARLAALAAAWGVQRHSLYERICLQLQARMWIKVPGSGGEEEGRLLDLHDGRGAYAMGGASQLGAGRGSSITGRGRSQAAIALEKAAEVAGLSEQGGGTLRPELVRGAQLVPVAKERESGALAAAQGKAEEEVDSEQAIAVAQAAQFAGGARASWQRELEAAEEQGAWASSGRAARDGVSVADVCRLLVALAKVNYVPSGPAHRTPPLPLALLTQLRDALPSLSPDAAASVALAATRLFRAGMLPPPAADAAIRAAVSRALYGNTEGRARDPALHRRILEYATGGGGGRERSDTDADADAMRASLGLSDGGALRLAVAVAAWPSVSGAASAASAGGAGAGAGAGADQQQQQQHTRDRERERDTVAALKLLVPSRLSRQQVVDVVAALRQRGRGGLVPQRLSRAAGEAAGPAELA